MDKKTLIVIEDSDDIASLIYRTVLEDERIEPLGYTASGKDGLEAIREHKPDIVTLDLNIEEISGIDVLKEINKLEKPPYVIIISGELNKEVIDEAKALKPFAYIEKPFQPAFIERVIDDIYLYEKNQAFIEKHGLDQVVYIDTRYNNTFVRGQNMERTLIEAPIHVQRNGKKKLIIKEMKIRQRGVSGLPFTLVDNKKKAREEEDEELKKKIISTT